MVTFDNCNFHLFADIRNFFVEYSVNLQQHATNLANPRISVKLGAELTHIVANVGRISRHIRKMISLTFPETVANICKMRNKLQASGKLH